MKTSLQQEPVACEPLRDIQARLSLGSESQIKAWTTLNSAKRIQEGLVFAGIFVVGCALMLFAEGLVQSAALVLKIFAVLLMGVAYNSLGLFIHEGLHSGLSRNKKTNTRCTFLLGVPLLISATAYRVTHTYHHIELGRARDYGTYRQHTNNNKLVWLSYYLQLTLGSLIYILFIPFLGFRHANRKVKRKILIEYGLIAVCFALAVLMFSAEVLVLYWLLPVSVMNVLTNIRGLASHALGDTRDPYLSSRTVQAPAWLSWIMLYENYHLAHHLYPKVPSYHLKAVHDHMWHKVPRACWNKSYLSFLVDFVKASIKGDLKPLGFIKPESE